MLATWLHAEDFVSLIRCMFDVPRLCRPVIYGMSDNDTVWWDNRHVAYLGWHPKHNSRIFKDKLDKKMPLPDKAAAVSYYQGGVFTDHPIMQRDENDKQKYRLKIFQIKNRDVKNVTKRRKFSSY